MTKENYAKIMQTKDETQEQAEAHHDRMVKFKTTLLEQFPEEVVELWTLVKARIGGLRLVEVVQKEQLLHGDDAEAEALRQYLNIPSRDVKLRISGLHRR